MGSARDYILVVTSDELFAGTMGRQLTDNGYAVSCVGTMAGAATAARATLPSLTLVDRREQDLDQFRRDSNLRNVPLIAIQPPGHICEEDTCLKDLERGVDMVLCNKGAREVIARVRAVLRRERLDMMPKSTYEVGALRLDIDRHEVMVEGRPVELTPKEFRILQHLILNPSRVFSRDELLNRIWGEDCALEEHTLDVHIHSLRQKIECDPARPQFVVTVRGVGYKLRAR